MGLREIVQFHSLIMHLDIAGHNIDLIIEAILIRRIDTIALLLMAFCNVVCTDSPLGIILIPVIVI